MARAHGAGRWFARAAFSPWILVYVIGGKPEIAYLQVQRGRRLGRGRPEQGLMSRKLPQGSRSDGGRPVILLVEDEAIIRLAVAESLRDEGLTVIEAASGAEGLAALSAIAPIDILVTDITMPGEPDGLALAAACRKICPTIPVVLASARLPDDGDSRADLMVAKPYATCELVSAVIGLLEQSWQDEPAEQGNRTTC